MRDRWKSSRAWAGMKAFSLLLDMREAVIALSLLMSLRYLIWRVTQTINYESPASTFISVTLVAAEIYGYLSVVLFYFQVRKPVVRPAPEVHERDLPSVDVFICIYNEPSDILYRTLVCCMAIDYPLDRLNIYVLDDGPREAIRAVAERFGAHHLTRSERHHAKAGNLNAALPRTRGEFILILDCDHIPVRSFLKDTVGYFQDPKVGFVQTPHHFYNADIFQHHLHLDNELVHEQDLFFQIIEPGREPLNAVMFAGSACVMRRAALESIGGMQTVCAIEDTHTSMRMQAKGWKGVYHNRILAAGLSPESNNGYLTQRKRWTRGGIQLFVLDNPLLLPGLNLSQKLCYFSSLLYFFHGLGRLVYLLAPLFFLIWRFNPIICGTWTLMTYFLPHYICAHMAVLLVSREYRNPFWSDLYEVAACFSLSWTAVMTLLRPEKLIFNVTPKDETHNRPHQIHWPYVLPHIALMVLLIIGVVVATRRIMDSGLTLDSYSLSCAWAAFNAVLLGCSIEGARERPQLRRGHRVNRRLPCRLSYHGRSYGGVATVISESGCLIELDAEDHLPPLVRVTLASRDYDWATGLSGEATELEGEVAHQDIKAAGGSRVGVKFTDISPESRQSLLRQMFSAPGSWDLHAWPFADSFTVFWHIVTSSLRPRLRRPKRMRRARARVPLRLDCVVENGGAGLRGMIKDMSVSGARVALPGAGELAERLTVRFQAGGRPFSALCRRVHKVALKAENQPAEYGLKFLEPDHLDPAVLEDLEDAAVA